MKIKFFLPVILSMFFCLAARSQNIAIGMSGGVSSLNLTNGGSLLHLYNSGANLTLAPQAVFFAELKYSKTFSLQPAIEYSAQGSKNGAFTNGLNTGGTTGTLTYDENNRAELSYLLLPVLAKFGWTFQDAPLRLYAAAGPFAALLLSARQTVFDSAPNSDNGQDVKPLLHNFNAGIEAKLGLGYVMGRGNLFIEGGGNYGLLKIQKATAGNGNYTGSITIAIGYSYWLGADFRTTNNPMRL